MLVLAVSAMLLNVLVSCLTFKKETYTWYDDAVNTLVCLLHVENSPMP